jgi:hypothetical protein
VTIGVTLEGEHALAKDKKKEVKAFMESYD